MAWFGANPSLDIEAQLIQRALYLSVIHQSGPPLRPMGANLFAYVLGDPVNFIDATGLDPRDLERHTRLEAHSARSS